MTEIYDQIIKSNRLHDNAFAMLLLERYGEGLKEILGGKSGKINLSEWVTHKRTDYEIRQWWIYNFFEIYRNDQALKLWLESGFLNTDNLWFEELFLKKTNKISTVFLLTGNINDYSFSHTKGYMPALSFLKDELIDRRGDLVVRFSLSKTFDYSKNDSSSPVKELESFSPKSGGWDRILSYFEFLDGFFKRNTNATFILEGADMIFGTEMGSIAQNQIADYLIRWSLAPEMSDRGNCFILTAETTESVSKHLTSQTSKIEIIHIPRPASPEERLKFLIYLDVMGDERFEPSLNNRSKQVRIPRSGSSLVQNYGNKMKKLAEKTAGLNFIGIEDLLLHIGASREDSDEKINEVKATILQNESNGILELISSSKDFDQDITGYEEIKTQLKALSAIINNPDASEVYKRTIPMGILFVGPPGTGKTVIAKAFSNKCGMNLLKMGDFRSKWVGESEQNLSKILDLISSYTPVIVFIDELDQTEGSRGGANDPGHEKRLFSKLLQFMSNTDYRGKVLWIGASNRPDYIDEALKRPGRFDLKIPFLPQNRQERKLTFLRYFEVGDNSFQMDVSAEEWEEILIRTRGFTGAEIEGIVNSVLRKKVIQELSNGGGYSKSFRVSGLDLISEITNFKAGIFTKNFREMLRVCIDNVTSLDLIPDYWIKFIESDYDINKIS